MKLKYFKVRVLITIAFFYQKACAADDAKCENINVRQLCMDQESCDDCLLAHECCQWCYDQTYSERSCDVLHHLGSCAKDKIEYNYDVEVEIPDDGSKEFTKISQKDNFEDIIQIKPQKFNIRLRPGVPVNFSFTYKSADNYPLELYYLGDLSVSMKDNLQVFRTLGSDLPSNLTKLTENYRLAYGSFMDKTGMPFYFTDPQNYLDPCRGEIENCETGYLFKHKLNFTRDTGIFTEKILNSKITANLDDLDGALDAIWQILVCGREIGWSVNSRKIILLPTDSLLHMAGDGLLVGAVLKPREECLLDDEGNHKDPLRFDFPSIAEIDTLLKIKKINIIFAVKSRIKLQYYRSITQDLIKDSAFVGELEANSGNILDLITKGFYNFARQVSFFLNTTQVEHIDAKFFADCENRGYYNETSTCYNVEKSSIPFIAQLTLKEQPLHHGNDILYIEEKNIAERVTLNVTYLEKCSCKNYDGKKVICDNGNFVCGECLCSEGWTGQRCEEKCEESDSNVCRFEANGTISHICNGNGECICGKCDCNFPYTGKFCQFECPIVDNQICSGPNHGTCLEGKCICSSDFIGKDCSCSLAVDNCKLFDTTHICSKNGDCVCNQCECDEGYSGRYCEINKSNNTVCEIYRGYVEDALVNGTYKTAIHAVSVETEEVPPNDERMKSICGEDFCTTVVFQGTRRCIADFCYYAGQDGAIHLLASQNCFLTATFQAITLGLGIFIAIVIAGLCFILITKLRLYRLEQAEYKRFQEEQKLMSGKNPLYKDPVTTYKNPLRKDSMQSNILFNLE